jgi:hypothetical protein
MTLSSRALLVSLSVSQWSARRYDKRETADLAQRHGTPTEVARVNKALLPFAKPLDAIHKKTGEIRTLYYQRTLPWGQHGVNIICAGGYMDFCHDMTPLLDEWRQLSDAFVAQYPQLRDNAKLLLNGLWQAEDYPDVDQVRAKFAIDVSFSPVPDAGDWRVSLSSTELDALRQQVTAKVVDSQAQAMKEAWRRVYEIVQHARDKLATPDAIFRDSLVTNAQDLCRLLPSLNIAGDPDLEAMRQRVELDLASQNPVILRTDKDARSEAARKLDQLMSSMSAFYSENNNG